MNILFFDSVCPKPYDPLTLEREGLGGTEATVVRVAQGLAGLGHNVVVSQHCRWADFVSDAPLVKYTGPEALSQGTRWDAVIVLRDWTILQQLQHGIKDARTKFYYWMHDLYEHTPSSIEYYVYSSPRTTLVCVSDWHKLRVQECFKAFGVAMPFPRVKRIYNPIDDALRPDETPVDKNKLVFFSSPHKGLAETVVMFSNARTFNPDFKLYVSNPGYFPSMSREHTNVVNLGVMPHHEIIRHVREALCVFYPNFVFPETFGLVLAEANAVGTPVIAHNHGAAAEVLSDRGQLVDCRDAETVIEQLMRYHYHRPEGLRAREDFRLKKVCQDWITLLNS